MIVPVPCTPARVATPASTRRPEPVTDAGAKNPSVVAKPLALELTRISPSFITSPWILRFDEPIRSIAASGLVMLNDADDWLPLTVTVYGPKSPSST